MVGALRGAATCGRCGLDVASSESFCTSCGARAVAPEPGSALGSYSGLLAGVQLAAPSRRRLASAIDFLPVPILIAVAAFLLTRARESERADLALLALLALLVYGAAHLSWFTARGRSLGRAILHLRTVDDLTGEPSTARAAFVPSPRTLTADLRRGRDPLRSGAVATPVADPGPGERREGAASAAGRAVDVEESPLVALILDSGERLEVQTSLLIGRSPVAEEGAEHPVFAWPDLSRSISKTHALFEWSGTVLWITDLASTNGTTLVAPDGARQPLVSGLRGAAAPGWSIRLGERTVDVHPSGVVGQ